MLRGKPTGQSLSMLHDGQVPIGSPAIQQFPWRPRADVFVSSRLCIRESLSSGKENFMGPSKIERGTLRPRFGRYLAVCAMAASLLFLISYPSAFAAGRRAFSIKVVTSIDDQFWVNSVIIEGTHEEIGRAHV